LLDTAQQSTAGIAAASPPRPPKHLRRNEVNGSHKFRDINLRSSWRQVDQPPRHVTGMLWRCFGGNRVFSESWVGTRSPVCSPSMQNWAAARAATGYGTGTAIPTLRSRSSDHFDLPGSETSPGYFHHTSASASTSTICSSDSVPACVCMYVSVCVLWPCV
jgi:hypothetical protein